MRKISLIVLVSLTTLTWLPSANAQSIDRSAPSPMLKNKGETAWESYKNMRIKPGQDEQLTDPILEGAIDLHAHFGPDTYPRQWDAFEVAKLAKKRGLRAIVLKNHWTESASTAYLARKYADAKGLEIFGAVSLNTTVGGLNGQAIRYLVDIEGRYGRVVWLPSHDSEHEVTHDQETRRFVRASRDGKLLPEIGEILDLVAQHQLTLATGHLYPEEMLAVLVQAKERGITRIIVTHPNLASQFTDPTIDQLRKAASLGAYIEVVAAQLLRDNNRSNTLRMIRAIGPEHCFVSSDSGLPGTNHTDRLVMAIRELRKAGFNEAELDLMFRRNPAILIGLPPLAN